MSKILSYEFSTHLQHAGKDFRSGCGLLGSTEHSVTFSAPRVDDIPIYARMSNTVNHHELHALLSGLYNAESALAFSSGMAAISTVFLTFLKPGDHVVVQKNCYGTTQTFFRLIAKQLQITFDFVESKDMLSAIKPETAMIHVETISNPFCEVFDFSQIPNIKARNKNILITCDNTFASPVNCNPLNFGVDLVVESGTKYLNGHSDVICGLVAGSKKNICKIYEHAKVLGGFLSARESVLFMRGLRTLELRVHAINENNVEFIKHMRTKNYVQEIFYGGSEQCKQHFKHGLGGMSSIRFKDFVDVKKLVRSFKLIPEVPSLGGTETTCTMPYFSTHYLLTHEEKTQLDIDQSLVRFSLGLEKVEDLIADIDRAVKESMH